MRTRVGSTGITEMRFGTSARWSGGRHGIAVCRLCIQVWSLVTSSGGCHGVRGGRNGYVGGVFLGAS